MRRALVGAPVVGIVGHDHVVPRHFGDLRVVGTPTTYVAAVAAAGALPVVLPGHHAADLVDRVDALVLTGGGDLDPGLHGGDPSAAREVDRRRDADELALLRAAAAAGVPTLAICRGMQLLAVADGGSLVDDLGMSHVLPGTGHVVRTEPGSLVARLLGGRPRVTSLHHQAVRDAGPSWQVTAWAADGVAEAMEWRGTTPWPVLAVQWHPELDPVSGPPLFGWVVRSAALGAERARAVAQAEPQCCVEP